jgi:hypothetical protein
MNHLITRATWTQQGYDIGLSGKADVVYVPEKFDFMVIPFRGGRAIVIDEYNKVISGTCDKSVNYQMREKQFTRCRFCDGGFQKKAYHQIFCSRNCKESYRNK